MNGRRLFCNHAHPVINFVYLHCTTIQEFAAHEMIRAVFFDFYHTLVTFDPPREELQASACREFGIEVGRVHPGRVTEIQFGARQ